MLRFLPKVFLLCLLLCCGSGVVVAQSGLQEQELRLKQLFKELGQSQSDSMKLVVNGQVKEVLREVLRNESSFEYPFQEIRFLGKLFSSDQKLRMYNWNMVMEDGTYRYFGFLQMRRGKNQVRNLELKEQKFSTEEVMTRNLNADNWMGALYYKIQAFKYKRKQYYLLLGWDGHNHRTNRKLIEILRADDKGDICFGAPLIQWRGKTLHRVVFEYTKQARMSLQYEDQNNRVVFDHLSPSLSRYQGQYEYYGPDFSHDALIFEKGIWKLVENVDVRNVDRKK